MPIEVTWGARKKDPASRTKEDNIKHGKVFSLAAKSDTLSNKYTKSPDPIASHEKVETFRLLPTDQSNLGIWEQAWEQVKTEEGDWKQWPQFQGVTDLKTKNVVPEVQAFAQRRRDEAEKDQAHVFGTSLTYRKMCSKVAQCAKKFEIVGDVVAQAEPIYAALPWTLVRFVIECAVGESDTWDSMLQGTVDVATHISKYPVIEQLYAKIDSELSKGLRDSLLKFFVIILKFQMHTIKYFDADHKGKRTILGMNPVTADKVKKELQGIQEAKERVDADIILVDAEVTEIGIENLKEGQKGQEEQLKVIKEGIKALSRDLDGDFSEAERHQQERHKDLIEMWKGPLDHMKKDAEERRIESEARYLSAVRTWLSVANPWENHERAKGQRRMKLGKWLLNDLEFKNWRTSQESSLLWLYGFAGTGKTGLVCRVIEELRESLKDLQTAQESRRLAIFYCSNDKAKTGRIESFSRADPEEALRSIVSQLCTKRSQEVAPILVNKYDASGPGSDSQMRLDYSDCVDVLVEFSKLMPFTIILDAFDECDQDKGPILIKHLNEVVRQSKNHIKIFISTRSFPAIEKDLKAGPSIEVTPERNKDDVREFIETTLDERIKDKELLGGDVERDLKEKIRDTLTSRARNMFLYASLLLNQLCDKNHTNDAESIRKKLDELPKNLVEMYNRTMNEIHDDKSNTPRSCSLAQDTFKWLLRTQRPLDCRELLEAISPPERKADMQEVLSACRTLVKQESDTIDFAHYSVREHLVQMEQYSSSQCNIVATRSCLRILNTYFAADESTRRELSEHEKSFKDYALLYWPLHYEGIAQADIAEHRTAINTMLRSFLLVKGRGERHKYKVYEAWFSDAQKLAEPLGDNKYMSSKLSGLRADPPTPLFAACVFGLDDLIAKFGRELDGLNKCNEDGQNALCLAVENNKLEAVKALLSRRFPANLNLLNIGAVRQFNNWNPAEQRKIILHASALQCAAATGRLDIAEFLIEEGAHVDLVAGYYGSPLQAACLKGHRSVVELLLRKGAEPNSQGGFHGNALQAAARGGHSDIINLLLENKPPALVNTPGGHYGSALMAAVCSGSSDTVSALLEEGAHPSERIETYGTPLEKAVSMGQASKDVVAILVEYEAEADLSPTGSRVHILHRAAMFGMNDLVDYCLNKGCKIDMTTTEGPDYHAEARFNWFPREMTPLAYACAEGHIDVVGTLLDLGAPFEEDRPHSAPLWAAAYQGHADVVDLLIRKFKETHSSEESLAFMDHLPDPDAGKHFILYAAASSGNPEVVRILLDEGAPYRKNSFGGTPLLATARFGCRAVTEVLLNYHKDGKVNLCLDERNGAGRTALFEACAGGRFDIASQLLDAGANLFIPNNDNGTTLHEACHRRDYKFVEKLVNKASENVDKGQFLIFLDTRHRPSGNTALVDCAALYLLPSLSLLLDRGADPLVRNNQNETVLHWACRHINPGLAQCLVDKVSERTAESEFRKFINQQPSSHKTALIDCAEYNNLQALNLLLANKADYTLHGYAGNTPLLWASGKGHFDVVLALVKHAKLEDREACPFNDFLNHRNIEGKNALFDAAKNNYLPIVKLLFDEGIDWSVPNNRGVTALQAASWEGNAEVVSALLAKAYATASHEDFVRFLNSRNDQGRTALVDAALRGHFQIVKQLLEEYNADYLTIDNSKCSALGLASWEGHTEVVSILLNFISTKVSQERFIQYLNNCNDWGKSALLDAAERGLLAIVKLLREQQYGADYRLANNNGVTALQSASWHGHKEVVAFLLKTASEDLPPEHRHAFIDHRNKWGKTALMDAIERNKPAIVDLLLNSGADYSIRDEAGFTALHYGTFRNQMAAVRTLLEHSSRHRTNNPDKFKNFLNQQGKRNGATALRDAVLQRHPDMARYLLEFGPAYDPIDSGRRTALHQAVGVGDEDLALSLLEYAAKDPDRERFRRFVNAVEENNDTVWGGAKRRGFRRLEQKLRESGVVATRLIE